MLHVSLMLVMVFSISSCFKDIHVKKIEDKTEKLNELLTKAKDAVKLNDVTLTGSTKDLKDIIQKIKMLTELKEAKKQFTKITKMTLEAIKVDKNKAKDKKQTLDAIREVYTVLADFAIFYSETLIKAVEDTKKLKNDFHQKEVKNLKSLCKDEYVYNHMFTNAENSRKNLQSMLINSGVSKESEFNKIEEELILYGNLTYSALKGDE